MRTITRYLYILCSALLYTIPFIFPEYTWFLLFFYLAPIIFISSNNYPFLDNKHPHFYRLRFCDGFLWGLLVFSLHPAGIWLGVIHMAPITSYPLYLLLLSIIIYYALSAGTWFTITDYIIRFLPQLLAILISTKTSNNTQPLPIHTQTLTQAPINNTQTNHTQAPEPTTDNTIQKTVFVWLITTTLYIRWVESYSLSLLTNLSGYALFSPLLPLLPIYPKLFFIPIFFTQTIALLLLHLPIVFIILWYHTKKLLYLMLFFCSCLPWIAGFIVTKKTPPMTTRPTILNNIAWLPFQSTGSDTLALIVKQKYKKILAQKPETKLIILPESAFYTESLCSTPSNIALWNNTHLSKTPYIICGSFAREKRDTNTSHFYNTCYLIHDGAIVQKFHKRECVPLIEYTPEWLCKNSISKLFFQELPAIDASNNIRKPLVMGNFWRCVPYICSELLLQEYADDNHPELPILALVNDSWVKASYIKNSMQQLARLKAITWQRDILYISYTYAIYICKNGSYYTL